MNKSITFLINNKVVRANKNTSKRLLDFLRDDLNVTGPKEGCGEGECGACTVILDGKIVNSCLVMAGSANNCNIITIEGVNQDGLDIIQKAFIDIGAVQCGYCIPGMVLSAKCLLDKNLFSSETEIREGISGNLCRCTGYEKIIESIKLAQKRLIDSRW